MKSVSSNKNTTVLLVITLAMALLFAAYYYIVKPKQDDVQYMTSEVNALKTEVSSLEQNLSTLQEKQSQKGVNEFTLRKKVPDSRAIDSLILNIEEIEYVTGTRIQSIDFNNYDAPVSSSGLEDPNTTTEQSSTEENEETEEVEETLPVSTIAVESLPPSLKLITFNIDVTSPDEESLINFIREIEQIERIMHVDTIDFSLPGEENEFAEDKTEVVSGSVQITTFYYE